MGTERDLMMTVSKIAKRAGMEPEVVRFYTRIGLLQPSMPLALRFGPEMARQP
jgi:hypothetical protein